jgi:hypothetical protein
VASHFSDIGFRIESSEEILPLARSLPADTPVTRTPAGEYFRWSPGGGAELWFQRDSDLRLVGMNPHFDAQTPTRARLTARQPDPDHSLDGGFHLWLDPAGPISDGDGSDSEGATPLFVDLPDYRAHDALRLPVDVDVQIAAFAHRLEVYATEADLRATGSPMAVESLIPSGLFFPGGGTKTPARAEAILYGTVEATEVRRNGATGHDFLWARVRTFGGRLEIVADPSLTEVRPVVGGIVGGTFWLSARIGAAAPIG